MEELVEVCIYVPNSLYSGGVLMTTKKHYNNDKDWKLKEKVKILKSDWKRLAKDEVFEEWYGE